MKLSYIPKTSMLLALTLGSVAVFAAADEATITAGAKTMDDFFAVAIDAILKFCIFLGVAAWAYLVLMLAFLPDAPGNNSKWKIFIGGCVGVFAGAGILYGVVKNDFAGDIDSEEMTPPSVSSYIETAANRTSYLG